MYLDVLSVARQKAVEPFPTAATESLTMEGECLLGSAVGASLHGEDKRLVSVVDTVLCGDGDIFCYAVLPYFTTTNGTVLLSSSVIAVLSGSSTALNFAHCSRVSQTDGTMMPVCVPP